MADDDAKAIEKDFSDAVTMRKVTGYVKRHLAQKPLKEDVETLLEIED